VTNLISSKTINVLLTAEKVIIQLLIDTVFLALNYVKLALEINVYNVSKIMLSSEILLVSHNVQMDMLHQETFVLNVMTQLHAENVKLMN